MEYKAGDKVVIKIEDARKNIYGDGLYYARPKEWASTYPIQENQILGKLEDFTKPEKIKFTKAEKKEFDKVINRFDTSWPILNCIREKYLDFPNLYNRLFQNYTVSDDGEKQIEFVKAIENHELIEVEKEKKYQIHFLNQWLRCDATRNVYYFFNNPKVVEKGEVLEFAQSEIDRIQKLPTFQAIDLEKCKEEVVD